MISSPHLSMTLLYNMSRRWSQYLNRCVAVSASKVVEAPRGSILFSLEPILVDLEGGRYISPILSISLVDLVPGRRSADSGAPKGSGRSINGGGRSGSGSGVSGNKNLHQRLTSRGDLHECGCAMKLTCPPCPFGVGRNRSPFWWGRSSPLCTVTFSARTDIFVGCAGRTVRVKLARYQPPRGGNHHRHATQSFLGGMIGVPVAQQRQAVLPPQPPGLSVLDLKG